MCSMVSGASSKLLMLHLMLSKQQFDRCCEFIGKGWAAGVTNYRIRSMRLFGLPLTCTATWMN
ncbi:hypothetical protein MTX20_29745 [Bradyrhizobium sp. ISRA435]|nr:hypothetical protein MTX20_29745 [Bradyrhizobium sp. ISRA435]